MKHWENINYQTIINASISNGTLNVDFENGDHVKIGLGSLIPFASSDVIKKLSTEDLDFSSFEICIRENGEERVISWEKIRVLTDSEFSRFLSQQAEDQSKLIGVKLKRLREKAGLKSNNLSERSGITPQTISRIENGKQTDISFTTLRKLLASMGYNLQDLVNEEVELQNEKVEQKSFHVLLKRLSKIGLDPSFVKGRLIPEELQNQLSNYQNDHPDLLLDEAASYLSNIYGWNVGQIWGNNDLTFDENSLNSVLFKKGNRSNINQIKAYVPYVSFLARTIIKANKRKRIIEYPRDIEDFKNVLSVNYGGVSLDSVLNYSWDMGICIVPLKDSGIFHGAAWRINGNPVIVLKQQVNSHARWIFDLLHEIYHILVHLKDNDDMILEDMEINPVSKNDDPKEVEANSFASQVIFDGDPEPYAQEAVSIARGKIENLKNAVITVADTHNLRVDALANYVAQRLSFQGSQWWGTAEGLQETEPEPYHVAREILLRSIDVNKLNRIDNNLLSTALNA